MQLSSAFMFLLVSNLDGLNWRNEPEKIPQILKVFTSRDISGRFSLESCLEHPKPTKTTKN